ncbi:hypothetical protein LSCM1_06244 [Leishmania martiniquensis]|uniref:Calponin-homology (CH) domain-containing protein n=1 Tax=Leishmania martiniquensis TaxID=1580590 RepID=A0A836HAF1_9TRYP|nr:hypothetical protein LSCM1_06244 [Leishmania martiniquensis]
MQREVIKWVQSLDLTAPIQNPKRDLATGHLAAEIVAHYSGNKYLDLDRLPTGAAAATKRDVWSQVYHALQQLRCTTVTQPLIDAVLRREPNAALAVLEYLYEHFTGHTLSMRGLDAVGTSEDTYVQSRNATSTALLLEATCDGPKKNSSSSVKEEISSAEAAHFHSFRNTLPLAGTICSGNAAAEAVYTAEDAATDESDAFGPAFGTNSARALQQRLALIDNSELAGGANALQAYPRYARPTASTLIHAASGTRKDVVLDRPKYAADEILQRRQNERITQQHAVVQRLQDEAYAATIKSPSRTPAAASAWAANTATSQPSLLPHEATLHSSKDPSTTASLTTLYRGRFFRQPNTTTATGVFKASSGSRKGGKGKREEVGAGAQRSAAVASAEDHTTIFDETLDRSAAASGDMHSPPARVGSGVGERCRVVPKLRVNVHSASLQAILARRSSRAQLQERAAALSREHFAKHNYSLRPALSDILADVLVAHQQLQHLFDSCVEDGSGEVLDNILGHLLAHRDEFPPACMQASWQALVQHVDGMVASLQRSPDDYSYLVESLWFAFSRDASQVPLLHISQAVPVSGDVNDAGQGDTPAAAMDVSLSQSLAAPTRRSTALSKGTVAGAGCAAAAAAPTPSRRSQLPEAGLAAEGETVGPRQRRSLSEALLTAAHRRASVAPGAVNGLSAVPFSRKRAIIDTRDGLSIACAFGLLYRLARQLDVQTAAYVLERYVLRSAKPFLLRHGTVAVREAVARVVSASFVPVPPKHTAAAVDAGCDREAADAEAEEAFTQFLTGTLARTVLGSSPFPCDSDCGAAFTLPDDSRQHSAANGDTNGTPPLPLRLQRTYWLIFFHAVADYPCASRHEKKTSSCADGPLATCVWKGAMTCFSCTDVDLLTIGVGLTMEYSERWLPRDAALTGPSVDDAVQRAYDLLSHSLPSFNGSADELTTPWWSTLPANSWECRLAVLQLCSALLVHPFFAVAESSKASAESSSGDGRVCSHLWRATVDAAAADCLQTFAEAPLWQLQLALGVMGKSVDKASAPALTDSWLQLLLSIPAASLLAQLMPYDEAPVRLRLLRPLKSAAGIKRAVESDWPKGVQRSLQQQALMLSSQCEQATRLHRAASAFAGGSESWMLMSETGSGECSSGPGTGAAASASAEAALRLVWGRVLSVYAVVPLNQTWNIQGVVDAVLPPLTGSAEASSPPAAPTTAPAVRLLVMAAALLSPPTPAAMTVTAAPSTITPYSPPAMSPADAEPVSVDDPGGAFWLVALRRAWPLFQACGVSQDPMKQRAQEANIVKKPPHDVDGVDGEASSSWHEAVVGRACPGVNQEDFSTIVLSLFLRFADDVSVTSAMLAAAGDGARLCESAITWAEAMCCGTPTTQAQ